MRRLKVNKKSLMQRGGTPAPKMAMDTDTILQDIREKVQGGVSEVEIFQNLMDQQIPLDEIQTAFTALGYDETMLSNIMQAIQQSASIEEEPVGEIQGSELPQAQYGQGFFGGNPAFSGTLATYHKSPDGYMPAKGFYLPQDLGNRGNIFGALSTAAEAYSTLFSGKDLNNDGVADGSLRDLGVKRRRHRDNRGSYYTYDVEYDPNDTNTYNLNAKDLFKGKLRTNEQYTQDLLDNSMINYNVNTGQYETLLSADKIKQNRFTLNDANRDILKGRSFRDFYTTLKDNPAHLEMLSQQIGLIKDDYLPAGVSYGVDKDGVAAAYSGANPYLYETMMGINVATGDKLREYTKDDLNTNPYRISTGGLQNNVGIKFPLYRFKSGGGGAGRGPAVATNRHTSQNSVSTGIDNSIGNPGDRTDYNQQQGNLDFSVFQAQNGGGFFDNFDFKGYFKGEQGLIPDYKGESTTATVNNAVDKYGDAVNTGLDVAQTTMTGVGMIPVVGNVVDLVNTGVSGLRAGVAGAMGDTDGVLKHTENMAINAGSAIPGVGIGIGAAGLAKDTATYTGLIDDKSIAANLGVGEPDFDKTQVTQAIGVGDQGDSKSKAGRGYELPKYQDKGEVTPLTNIAKNVGLGIVSPFFASKDLVNKISDIDLGELEDQVNENLGYTMNREVTADRDPNVKKAVELRSKFYTDPKYQSLREQLDNEYIEGGEDEFGNTIWELTDKGKKISEELDEMSTAFYNENKDLFSADEAASFFYNENADPIRHGTTGGLTAKAISDKIKDTPYIGGLLDFIGADDLGGVVGSNVLGLGHELAAYMDYGKDQDRSLLTQMKESGKDMYNNFIGSLASVGAEDDEQIIDRVVEGVKEGKYTSGRVESDEGYDNPKPEDVGTSAGRVPFTKAIKQQGGPTTLYEYYDNLGLELPSVAERRPAFQEAFGENTPYTGTAAQNTQFLEYLQSTDNPAPSSNTNMPNTETPVEEVSAPENDPQDFSLFNNPVGPVANNEGEESNLITDPGQLTANLINNQALPGGDGSGDLTEDGTATTQIQDFDVISDANTTVPNPTAGTEEDVDPVDPKIKKPKVTRRNKLAGTVNRVLDSPGMQAFGDVSGALVAGANVANAFFDERNYNKAKEDLVFMGMADKAYGMYEERDGDRGNFDENTGLMQPDNMRGYMARMGTETFMKPPAMQEDNIVDLDYETVAKLISAGADIEIL